MLPFQSFVYHTHGRQSPPMLTSDGTSDPSVKTESPMPTLAQAESNAVTVGTPSSPDDKDGNTKVQSLAQTSQQLQPVVKRSDRSIMEDSSIEHKKAKKTVSFTKPVDAKVTQATMGVVKAPLEARSADLKAKKEVKVTAHAQAPTAFVAPLETTSAVPKGNTERKVSIPVTEVSYQNILI